MVSHPIDVELGCSTCLGLMVRRVSFPVSHCGQWGFDKCDTSRGLGSCAPDHHDEKNIPGEALLQRDTSSLNQTCKLELSLANPILDHLQLTDRYVSKNLHTTGFCNEYFIVWTFDCLDRPSFTKNAIKTCGLC